MFNSLPRGQPFGFCPNAYLFAEFFAEFFAELRAEKAPIRPFAPLYSVDTMRTPRLMTGLLTEGL